MKHEHIGKCRICGIEYSCFLYAKKSPIRTFMFEEGVCGACAAWMTRRNDPEAIEEIIDGTAYHIYPFVEQKEAGDFLGGKGHIKYIMKLDTLEVYRSNDVWVVGTPPPAFHVPDTAIFVEKFMFKPLEDGPFVCHGTACLDRYTCAFYFKKMEKDKPVNKIPDGWKDGDERCQTYLNINKINQLIMEWRTKKQ